MIKFKQKLWARKNLGLRNVQQIMVKPCILKNKLNIFLGFSFLIIKQQTDIQTSIISLRPFSQHTAAFSQSLMDRKKRTKQNHVCVLV